MDKRKTILVPTDFDTASLAALRVALDLGRSAGARVVVLHAYAVPFAHPELPGHVYERLRRQAEDEASRSLDDLAVRWGVDVVLRRGDPVEHALRTAEDVGAYRIVMGTHGRRGVGRLLLGSVAEAIVRRSPIPVMTVRGGPKPEDAPTARHDGKPIVLAGVDFDPGSERAVALAREVAAEVGGSLELVHAYTLPFYAYSEYDPMLASDLDVQLAKVAERSLEALRVRTGAARWHLRRGPAGHEILDVAGQIHADVIVLGTHARTGAARIFIGSVAEWVLRRSSVPVLTARLPEEATVTKPAGAAISMTT